MLCQRLSVPPLPVPPDMKAPFMSLVILPVCLGPATKENEDRLREKLFHDYGVQTNTCVVDGRLCCRLLFAILFKFRNKVVTKIVIQIMF